MNAFLPATGSNFLSGGGLQNPGTGRAGITNQFGGNLQMPYSMQWNGAVQQALWESTTIEVKYMGNRGVHLPAWSQLGGMAVTANRSLPIYDQAPGQSELNNLNLTLNQLQATQNDFTRAGFTNPINQLRFDGLSMYHGAAVTLNHRFTGGFQANAKYAWSQWRTTSTGTPLDMMRPADSPYFWSLYDRRHLANVTALWDASALFRDTGVLRACSPDSASRGATTMRSRTNSPRSPGRIRRSTITPSGYRQW